MAVYVDNMKAQYRGMIMCHMVADSLDELHQMADLIGVNRKWFQCLQKARYPHYDICLSKKNKALRNGAIEISSRKQLIEKCRLLREELLNR